MIRAVAALVAMLAPLACSEERALQSACGDEAGVPCSQGIHPDGFDDPASNEFHGAELRRRDYDFALCASCHGDDLDGGASGVSCRTCHEDGPTSCSTCHDEEPATGSHDAHLGGGPMERRWECAECHTVPDRWDAPGHIVDADGRLDPAPAEVVLARGGACDASAGTCTGGCHLDAEPRWTRPGQGEAACGSCHGTPPPAPHAPQERCATCHPTGDASHIDGELDVGGGCTGCHGEDGDPAPPRDLTGDTLVAALGVGAHQAHLDAPRRLRGPLACADCHDVPATRDAPGHIDSALPAEVALVGGGAWDRAAATCDSWCHGDAAPVWTVDGGEQVACGTCHGVPPADADHAPDLEIDDCAGCHPDTVDAFGNVILTGAPGSETSQHMDGEVDVGL